MRVLRSLGLAILMASAARGAWAQAPVELGAKPSALISNWLHYRIEAGRLVAWCDAAGPHGGTRSNVSHTQVNQTPSRNERLSLEIKSGAPSVRYELHVPSEDVFIELHAWNQFTIRRAGKAPGLGSFHFTQPVAGDLILAITSGSEQTETRAADFWRLVLCEPELCRQSILPLLASMRSDWRLPTQIAEIEDELFHIAANPRGDDRRQWRTWVLELGSDTYKQRAAAHRNLTQAGPLIAPFLERIDDQRLDAEQRERVRQILAGFGRSVEDSTEQAAARLAGDAKVWLALAKRSDEPRRRLAAQQLAKCFDRPVDFDPAAEAEKRAEQLEKLRIEIAKSDPMGELPAEAKSSAAPSPQPSPSVDD